jgi:transposase
LLRHPHYHLHFTPTHSSWLNQVEGWFALPSQRQIKRGSHYSVRELESAILEFIEVHDEKPKPFVWTKNADAILNSIGRFASRTLDAHGANNM